MQENEYIINIELGAETARLLQQDNLTTRNMGGVLPPDYDMSQTRSILDLGCGPGGWCLEAAYKYPDVEIIGVDLSEIMVQYCNDQARVTRRQNLSFYVMDIRSPLPLDMESFDLINMRFLSSAIRPAVWPALLAECHRLLRPGGRVRWTDNEPGGASTSPAFETLIRLLTKTMAIRHLAFFPDGHAIGLTPRMGKLLRDAGFQILDKRAYLLEASHGTRDFRLSNENILVLFELIKENAVKAGLATKNELEHLTTQLKADFDDPDYCFVTSLHSWLAEKPT